MRDRCTDADGDGVSPQVACGLVDCDDGDPRVYPGAIDIAGNDLDEDCRGGPLPLVVHVSPTGTWEGGGTPERPYDTILGALSYAVPGGATTLRIAAGDYNEELPDVPLTLEGGFDPQTWTLDPGRYVTVIRGATLTLTGAQGVWVTGLHLRSFSLRVDTPGPAVLRDVVTGTPLIVDAAADLLLDRTTLAAATSLSAEGTPSIVVSDGHLPGIVGVRDGVLTVSDSTTGFVQVVCTTADPCGATLSDTQSVGLYVSGHPGTPGRVALTDVAFHEIAGSVLLIDVVGRLERVSIATGALGPNWGQHGALYAKDADVTVVDTTLLPVGTAAIDAVSARVSVAHTIVGGVVLADATALTVVDTVLLGAQSGPALRLQGGSEATLAYSAIGTPACVVAVDDGDCLPIAEVRACAWSGCAEVVGVRATSEPLFAGPGDYHAHPDGMLVDAGFDPAQWGIAVAAVDGDGDARPAGSGWDIGIDEVR